MTAGSLIPIQTFTPPGTFGGQTLDPLVHRNRFAKGAGESLEYLLRHMMAVYTIHEVDVQGYSTMIRK
jgi:hypothetical protein